MFFKEEESVKKKTPEKQPFQDPPQINKKQRESSSMKKKRKNIILCRTNGLDPPLFPSLLLPPLHSFLARNPIKLIKNISIIYFKTKQPKESPQSTPPSPILPSLPLQNQNQNHRHEESLQAPHSTCFLVFPPLHSSYSKLVAENSSINGTFCLTNRYSLSLSHTVIAFLFATAFYQVHFHITITCIRIKLIDSLPTTSPPPSSIPTASTPPKISNSSKAPHPKPPTPFPSLPLPPPVPPQKSNPPNPKIPLRGPKSLLRGDGFTVFFVYFLNKARSILIPSKKKKIDSLPSPLTTSSSPFFL